MAEPVADGGAAAAATAELSGDESPDEIASSDDASVDSLLSALSSHRGDANELTVTPAELLDELLLAWSNEKLCPDLLPHRDDLVECVRDQLEGIDRQLAQRSRVPKDLAGYLHKLEISRVRYLVTDLLRCRLAKIQAYAEGCLAGGRWAGRLSPAESEFGRHFVASLHRHFDTLALGRMPQFLRPRPHPVDAPKPNSEAFVFLRVRPSGGDGSQSASLDTPQHDRQMVVRPAREAEAVELRPGEQHLMQYAPIEQLLLDDRVQLI